MGDGNTAKSGQQGASGSEGPASQGKPPAGKQETKPQHRAEDWGERDAVGEEIASGGKGAGQGPAKPQGT